VPIGATVQSIQAMKEATAALVGPDAGREMGVYLDYYLRYATYAMLAGDTSILDERVLNGLKETYNSLGVPIGATVQSIQAMKEATAAIVGPDAGREMGVYLDYISSGLGN